MNDKSRHAKAARLALSQVSAGFLLLFLSCAVPVHAESKQDAGSAVGQSIKVPQIDEIAYWHKVKQLSLSGEALTEALRLKPKFREDLLAGRLKIDQLPYSKKERSIDEDWVRGHQQLERQFKPRDDGTLSISGYPIEQFVGYRCGPVDAYLWDDDGLCYKVFFDFQDAARDLTPQLYFKFVQELDKAGFVGDSKNIYDTRINKVFYNDIIVHTGSAESAKLAEQVGFKLFGTRLAHYATGVDVQQTRRKVPALADSIRARLAESRGDGSPAPHNLLLRQSTRSETVKRWKDPIDWHHFLTKSDDLSRLSPKALKFVECSPPRAI